MDWKPLSARTDQGLADEYQTLRDDIPPWLAPSLSRWVRGEFQGTTSGALRSTATADLHELEQRLRLVPALKWGNPRHAQFTPQALGDLVERVAGNDARALDILDGCLMVRHARSGTGWRGGSLLDVILENGGSAWKVGRDPSGRPCLERRVDETVENVARSAMTEPGNHSRHLSVAWHKLYGANPDASAGYREAVRAVEAAAKPVILPNDDLATLGKMIRALRDKPAKWVAPLLTVEAVADMMDQLWTSQLDRHGTDDESIPLAVSLEQAEAALHLAVTLVHWCQSGALHLSA